VFIFSALFHFLFSTDGPISNLHEDAAVESNSNLFC